MLSVAAAPEQWLGKFMLFCVIIIKQVSRGMAGEENGVRRARSEEPGRRVESEECRGGRRRRRQWPRAQRELGSLRDCVSTSSTWCQEGRWAMRMALEVQGVEAWARDRK